MNKPIPPPKYATVDYVDRKIGEVNTNVNRKINEVNNNTLELFKVGLTPLYKKLKIKLPKQFEN
jgi:hypothetical protein